MAARHFDEILLDDYFFFDRKTDFDIKAKGDKTWTEFRLEAMRDADPFVQNSVAQYELLGWSPVIGKDDLDKL